MIRVFLAIIISMFVVGSSFAADTDVLYDGLYSRPTYFPDFVEPSKWPNNMTCFVLAYDEKGVQIDNYEVAVYDQDGELRAIGRSIPSQHNLCALTIMGIEGDVFSFQIIYGDFVNPKIRDTYTTCEFYTNKTISASNPLQLFARSELVVYAEEDPDNPGNYYTTFYSGLEAYTLPEGVKAYTAEVDGENIVLTRIEGPLTSSGQVILPQGEAVLLYSNELQDGNFTLEITDPTSATNSTSNQFCGVDVQTTQEDYGTYNFYMLSYGQKGLAFYKMSDTMMLSANKAFIVQPPSAPAKVMRMVFAEEETGIDNINDGSLRPCSGQAGSPTCIYSVSGVRQNKLQKGINIMNSKKIVVK